MSRACGSSVYCLFCVRLDEAINKQSLFVFVSYLTFYQFDKIHGWIRILLLLLYLLFHLLLALLHPLLRPSLESCGVMGKRIQFVQ